MSTFLAISPSNEVYVGQDKKALIQDHAILPIHQQQEVYEKELADSWRFFEVTQQFDELDSILYKRMGTPLLSPERYFELRKYQQSLGYGKDNASIKEKMDNVRLNSLSMVIELGEMLQELPHKPWRAIEDQVYNSRLALEEYIDVIFFVLNINIAMDWRYADVLIAYDLKMRKNKNRITTGYNTIQEETK